MQYPSQFPFFKLLCYCCFYYKTDFALPLFGHTYKTEGPSFYFDAYAVEVKSVFFFFLLCFSELFFCLNSQDVDFLPSHKVLFLRRGAKKNSSALCCLSFAFFFFKSKDLHLPPFFSVLPFATFFFLCLRHTQLLFLCFLLF